MPTISTQVRTDSKLKRPHSRADAWKQKVATTATIADVPISEKRLSRHGAVTSNWRTKSSAIATAAITSTVAYRSSSSSARWRGSASAVANEGGCVPAAGSGWLSSNNSPAKLPLGVAAVACGSMRA